MNALKNIGFIGTGVMGKSMCKHLIKAGYQLSVYNRTISKTEELVQLGAKVQEPIEMAKSCEAVFLMLGYPHDVEAMVLGEKGILNHMKKGSYLVDHTTSSPGLAKNIATQCAEKGIFSYDAPVSGGDIGAREARLVVMTGGEEKDFEPVKSVMNHYSSKVQLMGGAGNGQHTKMTNQTMIAGGIIGVVEGMIYGHKAGLDLNNVIPLLGGGAAGSFNLNVYGPRIMNKDFEPGFFVEHFVKDLEITLKECEAMKLDLKGLKLAHSFYRIMMDKGMSKKGIQGIYVVLEELTKM